MIDWLETWNEKAKAGSMFEQMGRNGYSPFQYFLMLRDIQDKLQLSPGDTLLDIGCGNGYTSLWAAPFVKEVVGIDFSEDLIKIAQSAEEYYGNVEFHCMDMRELQFIGNVKFSKVLVGSAFQYLKSLGELCGVLEKLYEITTENAAILSIHNPDARYREVQTRGLEARYERENTEYAKYCMECNRERLWLDYWDLRVMAKNIGYRKCLKLNINPALPQCTHMYDFILIK